MAYDKHTWTCDEPITVERLNHIEDGIANAGGDCGFQCEEDVTLLTEESVTTTMDGDTAYGDLSYSQRIDADSITVTFDGVEYECPRVADSKANFYGAPWNDSTQAYDWSEYPFAVVSDANGSSLATETAGTYTIKITASRMTVTTTQCFEDAVNSVIDKIDCDTVPKEAYIPTLINLTPPSPAFTIHANTDDHIRFSTENNLSMYAVIRSINLPSGLVIRGYVCGYVFSTSYITLSVRNVTDSDISVSGANLSMQVVDFASSNRVCVMLGTNCGGHGPK